MKNISIGFRKTLDRTFPSGTYEAKVYVRKTPLRLYIIPSEDGFKVKFDEVVIRRCKFM